MFNQILMFIVLSVFSKAILASNVNEYQVFQMNKNTDISSLKGKKRYLKDLPRKSKAVNRLKRDALLEKYIPEISKDWDELDRDLFVQRLASYKEADFFKKYKNTVSKKVYLNMRKEWL